MAHKQISKPTAGLVFAELNHRKIGDPSTTIMNNTGANIVVRASAEVNRDGDLSTLTYAQPAEGATTITAGEFAVLTNPYTALEFVGAGTGTIDIVENY